MLRKANQGLVFFISTLAIFFGVNGWGPERVQGEPRLKTNPPQLSDYLVEFHRNPKLVMNTRLATFDEAGVLVTEPSRAERLGLSHDEVWRAHNSIRDRICRAGKRDCSSQAVARSKRSAIDEKNSLDNFLFEPTYLNQLSEMESKGLLKAQIPQKPWSDSFWPTVKGLIARRWMDRGFPDNPREWLVNYNYAMSMPPGSAGINSMSPAEKYDLLVGDSSYRLTEANWRNGRSTYEKQGRVPGWTGLCHGWAPASFMTPAPKRSVTVPAVNGTMITFYPSDIKALATEAWGESPPTVKFAGSKCAVPRPRQDENGRVIDPGCFDVNPATWHIGIVNQMGVNKSSFVFDSQYDYQIWNYPIYSYHYRYFNPQTLEHSESLGPAVVNIRDYSIDKFKKYRSDKAKYIVGIEMDIFYSIETSPSSRPVQEPRLQSKKWVYDLEIDASGAIIGGEWYSNFHPDFMWSVPKDGKTKSDGENELTLSIAWDGTTPVPEELREAARISSERQQPVSTIVDTLVRLSQIIDANPP